MSEVSNAGTTGTKTCVVWCKLPNGLIIEAGWDIINGNLIKTPGKYKRQFLAGANQAVMNFAEESGQVPIAPKNHKGGITVNVDEAFFDAWVSAHKDTNIVLNRMIGKCKSIGEARALVQDDSQRRTGWEPRPQITVESSAKTKFKIEPRKDEDEEA